MIYGLETPLTLFVALIGSIIVMYAQAKINTAYKNYRNIRNKKGISGQEVARMILDQNGLSNVHVVAIKGELTDHYDPSRKVVRLSTNIFHGDSIASMSVAAHECGHAIQDKEGYRFMRIRSALVPVVNFVTYSGYFVTFFALFMGVMTYVKVGIIILLATLLFQLVTLPVEFDASKRAKDELKKLKLTEKGEDNAVSDMLSAAAFTYVASLFNSILNLLRMIIMVRGEDD